MEETLRESANSEKSYNLRCIWTLSNGHCLDKLRIVNEINICNCKYREKSILIRTIKVICVIFGAKAYYVYPYDSPQRSNPFMGLGVKFDLCILFYKLLWSVHKICLCQQYNFVLCILLWQNVESLAETLRLTGWTHIVSIQWCQSSYQIHHL